MKMRRGLGKDESSSLLPFKQSLAEAIEWHHLHYAQAVTHGILRSAELNPELPHLWSTPSDPAMPFDPGGKVAWLILRRREALPRIATSRSHHGPVPEGRLLAFDFNSTLSDGAAEEPSLGYVDEDNVPAWDAWIHYDVTDRGLTPGARTMDRYLVSWVPPELVPHVEKAIRCNPEECIVWASTLKTPFSEALRREGLLH